MVFATKAKDPARGSQRSLGIKPSDTLQTALEQMIANEVTGHQLRKLYAEVPAY
jgi:hypothetical protein